MSETWIIKDTAPVDAASRSLSVNAAFQTDGADYTGITMDDGTVYYSYLDGEYEAFARVASFTDDSAFVWTAAAFKTLIFDTAPTGELLTWLTKNADKQPPKEYLTNEDDLMKIADAIRAAGGTTEPLTYPDGFVAAIEALAAGT